MRLDDRPAGPTHVGQSREQLHTHILRVPQYLNWQPKTEKEAIAIVLKAIVVCHMLPQLKEADVKVRDVLFAFANGKHFQRTGELFAWPGEVTLLEETGLSPTGVYRALRRLRKLGIVEGGIAEVEGRSIEGFFLNAPETPLDWSRRRKSVRQARGILGKCARAPQGARSEGQARAPKGARARPGGRAPQGVDTLPLTRARLEAVQSEAVQIKPASSSSSSPPVEEPQPVGGAAAAELRDAGVWEEAIEELIQLPATTRENVLALRDELTRNKRIDNLPAALAGSLRKGMKASAKSLALARAKLRRQEKLRQAVQDDRSQPAPKIEPTADAMAFVAKYQARKAGVK